VSNGTPRAEIGAEAYEPSPDDPVNAAGDDASEFIDVGADEEVGPKELEELGKSHDTSFRSLLVTSFSRQD
jgi:hypothetical protein